MEQETTTRERTTFFIGGPMAGKQVKIPACALDDGKIEIRHGTWEMPQVATYVLRWDEGAGEWIATYRGSRDGQPE